MSSEELLEREITIAFGKNRTDTHWKNDYVTWNEFVNRLRNLRRTEESMSQYDSMTDAQKGRVKDGPSFVGGFVRGGRRIRGSVESRCLFTLDVDHANEGFIELAEILALNGSAHVIYSTHSHREDKPKYRIVALASRDMTPDEYAAASRRLAYILGMEYFDKTTFDVNRLMYLPSCSKDAEPIFEAFEGEPVDVDALLAEYENWMDMSQWHRHPGDHSDISKVRGKLKDSRDKEGLVGQFNRAFSPEEAIAEFIQEVYTPVLGQDDRWTYVPGTSDGGMRIYPDGHMYSEHQSDPANTGHCYNAYDMVRIHLFGHMDLDTSKHTNIMDYPSQKAMREFAGSNERVRRISLEEDFGGMDKDLGEGGLDRDDDDWFHQLETDKRDPKKILSSSHNAELILKNGPFKNVLAYDEFLNSEVIRDRLPWRGRKRTDADYEPWLGHDDNVMQHYFGKVYRINSKAIIMNAFKAVVHQNEFHPVKEYLLSQKWDGIERLETLFIHYNGAEDNLYVRAATRKMFIAAVSRVFNPGCKFDYMLVLVGPQGARKSTILSMMGRQWFSDSLKSFDSKEAGEHLQSSWIFEFGELAAMKKSEVDEVKAFITKTSDKYRVAYDRIVTTFPRKCVFFGTTNNYNFLKDSTGNRRFWPIDVVPDKRIKDVFTDLTEYEIDQLWAEALHYHGQGESLELPVDIDIMAKHIQEEHLEEDPRVGMVSEYLEKPLPENWLDLGEYERRGYLDMPIGTIERDRVCAAEVWVECYGKRFGDMRSWDARDIYNILRKIPNWDQRKGRVRVPVYGTQTVFEKLNSVTVKEIMPSQLM
ncbi:virulence-associated E family protein [Paenibacillus sp. CMAA1364]